jgi:hypothetical protein
VNRVDVEVADVLKVKHGDDVSSSRLKEGIMPAIEGECPFFSQSHRA